MKRLLRITINNYITYKKKTELSLRPGSLTVIRGHNKDRKDKNSSNGAGKSLLVNTVPSMLFNTAPLPMKVKKTPKEGFLKDTYHMLHIKDDLDNTFEVKKYFKGTTRLQITKNGKDLKIKDSSLKEKSEASVHLSKILPYNEEQFFTMYYFDIKRPSAFQYGSDAQRHHFIEKLFKLDIYDQIAAEVKKDWDASKLIIQEIEILDEQLTDKSSNLKHDPEELRKKHKKLLEKTEALRVKVTDLMRDKDQCHTFILLSSDIKETSIDTLSSKIAKHKGRLKDLRQSYADALAHNESIKSNKEITTNKKRLLDQLTELKGVKVDATIQKTITEDKKLLDDLETITDSNTDLEQAIKEIDEELVEIREKLKATDKAVVKKADKFDFKKIEKARVRERIVLKELETNLQDTLDHLKSHGEQNCPVCSTLLDEETLKTIVKQKKKNIELSVRRMNLLNSMFEYKKLKETEQELTEDRKEKKSGIKSVNHSSEELEARISKNEELLGRMRKKVMLKAKIAELPDVEDKEPVKVDGISEDINKEEERLAYYENQRNKLQQLAKLDLPFKTLHEATEKQHSIDSALSQYQPVLDKLQERLSSVSVNAVQADTLSKDIQKLSAKINELKLSAPNFKIQTVLRKAFGPRGIRKQRVAEIGLALETTLNKYAQDVFDFPITFELVITDTKFQILAHRNKGVGDVRNLSGAEARYFSLLLMTTLLKHTPKDMLLDTVFLDEAEASLDKGFRDRLVSTFIPLLREVVSKVVIITPIPDSEFFIPKATQYLAVKENGVSTLTKL